MTNKTQIAVLPEFQQKLRQAISVGAITDADQQTAFRAFQELTSLEAWNEARATGRLKRLRTVPSYIRAMTDRAYRFSIDKRQFPAGSVFRSLPTSHGARIIFFKYGNLLVVADFGDHYISIMVGAAPAYEVEEGVYHACDYQ